MSRSDLKLYYWADIDASVGPYRLPEHVFALATSKEHAVELVVEDYRENLVAHTSKGVRVDESRGKIGQLISPGSGDGAIWSRPGQVDDQPGSYLNRLRASCVDALRNMLIEMRCHIHYKPVGFVMKSCSPTVVAAATFEDCGS